MRVSIHDELRGGCLRVLALACHFVLDPRAAAHAGGFDRVNLRPSLDGTKMRRAWCRACRSRHALLADEAMTRVDLPTVGLHWAITIESSSGVPPGFFYRVRCPRALVHHRLTPLNARRIAAGSRTSRYDEICAKTPPSLPSALLRRHHGLAGRFSTAHDMSSLVSHTRPSRAARGCPPRRWRARSARHQASRRDGDSTNTPGVTDERIGPSLP